MSDELLSAVRAAMPGSRITDVTLRAVLDVAEPIIRAQAQPAQAVSMVQVGWLCNGVLVTGDRPAPHWQAAYVKDGSGE